MEMTKENIIAVENFFNKFPPPNQKMRLSKCSVVTDPIKMVKVHIATCKTYSNNSIQIDRVRPYWERLLQVGKITKHYYKINKNGK